MSLSNHFEEHFATIEDPRKDNHNRRHKLMDMLVLTILAVISGAEDWVAVERFGECVRAHWNIENNLHWSLDVSFNEDQCHVRKGHAAENFAVIRHIALNLLKQEKTAKVGIANKRKMAGWNNQYLAKVLAVQQN